MERAFKWGIQSANRPGLISVNLALHVRVVDSRISALQQSAAASTPPKIIAHTMKDANLTMHMTTSSTARACVVRFQKPNTCCAQKWCNRKFELSAKNVLFGGSLARITLRTKIL